MKRWLARGLGLLVLLMLLLFIFFHALDWSPKAEVTPDSAVISNYRANFVVDRDGDLRATEKLRVSFQAEKHGIFRFFDRRDPNDATNRLMPRDIRVTRDGQQEPYEVLREKDGRIVNVKIGSPDVTLVEEHTYVIRYTIRGVLAPADTDRSEFYWNLIGQGWRMPIGHSELGVRLPAAPEDVQCAVGMSGSSGCEAQVKGNTLRVTTGELRPNTPVTVRTTLDVPAPDRTHKLWSIRFDPVLGPNLPLLLVILVLAALAGLAGWRASRSTDERDPAFPLMYGPPEGVGPAQAKYLFTEGVDQEAFVAAIMQGAEKGATTLSRDAAWTITDAGDPARWGELDPVTSYAAQALGVPGGSFTADKSVATGKTLKNAIERFEGFTREWAKTNGLMVRSGFGPFGATVWIASAILTGWLALANPMNVSALALIPGLWTVFSTGIAMPGAGTRRTRKGRDLWSRIGGFRRILATSSAEQRFEFSGRRELYTAYIPYAVAFGVADRWAEKYRTEMGEEPPAPVYFAAGAGYATGAFASEMASDFSASVSSAISAYNATQSSSSGGGFSGGGGGGGGGGGSW